MYMYKCNGVMWGYGRVGARVLKCLATAARAQKFCASPENSLSGGGGGDSWALRHIFPTSKIPPPPPKKKKKKKKKKSSPSPPPPPWRRHWAMALSASD